MGPSLWVHAKKHMLCGRGRPVEVGPSLWVHAKKHMLCGRGRPVEVGPSLWVHAKKHMLCGRGRTRSNFSKLAVALCDFMWLKSRNLSRAHS